MTTPDPKATTPEVPRPPIGTVLHEHAVNYAITVSEHTQRGFKYTGAPRAFIPKWGLSFAGGGEIFVDVPGFDWRTHYTVVPPPTPQAERTGTPRTDHVERMVKLRYDQAQGITPEQNAKVAIEEMADFARTLERELGEAKHRDEINFSQIRVMAKERDEQRALLAQQAATIARAEAELAESLRYVKEQHLAAWEKIQAALPVPVRNDQRSLVQQAVDAIADRDQWKDAAEITKRDYDRLAGEVELHKKRAESYRQSGIDQWGEFRLQIKGLEGRLATAEKDAQGDKQDIFNVACRDLPDEWRIRIECERGSCTVKLIDPESNQRDMHADETSISEQILNGIDAARPSAATEGKE